MIEERFIYLISTSVVLSSIAFFLKGRIRKIIDNGIVEIENQILNSKKDKLDTLNILETLEKEKNMLIFQETIEISKYNQEIEHNTEKEKEKIINTIEKELDITKNKIFKFKKNKLNEFKSSIISTFLDLTKENYKVENNNFTISSVEGMEKVFIDKTKE